MPSFKEIMLDFFFIRYIEVANSKCFLMINQGHDRKLNAISVSYWKTLHSTSHIIDSSGSTKLHYDCTLIFLAQLPKFHSY